MKSPTEENLESTRQTTRLRLKQSVGLVSALMLVASVIGIVIQQQIVRSRQVKIASAIESLQNTHGSAVGLLIKTLADTQESELIRRELQHRFDNATAHCEKLSLAFGLAGFGQVESEYLVSQIDRIEDSDTANLSNALGMDPSRSIEAIKKAAAECTTPELEYRKARLALASLGFGNTDLATEVCEFEGQLHHGERIRFIDQFPRWEHPIKALVETVRDSTSPALRSAVAIGLGKIPGERISAKEKVLTAELANNWYRLPDSSTHCAVGWLLREWQLPEPTVTDATKEVDGRNWFINSQGSTFVRINTGPVKLLPLDDLDLYEEDPWSLTNQEYYTEERLNKPVHRLGRANLLFKVGQFELALKDVQAALEMDFSDSIARPKDVGRLHVLLLARLGRTEEIEDALLSWKAFEPTRADLDYVECVVPLWLGRKQAAVERLNLALAEFESMEPERLYRMARCLANFAADGSATAEERKSWIDRSLSLLHRWAQDDEFNRSIMRESNELRVLRSDPRFVEIAARRTIVAKDPYWLANRELTRGEYEAFLDDTNDQRVKPTIGIKALESVSPTPYHPALFVSWYDAVLYCNWLSIKENRKPAYRSIGKVKILNGENKEMEVDDWELNEGSDGYRLPTELEWSCGRLAGSQDAIRYGIDDLLFAAYCQMYPSTLPSMCGRKLPNPLGLHDMPGNVSEWCWGKGGMHGELRPSMGGYWYQEFSKGNWNDSDWTWCPESRNRYLGFRLALNIPASPISPEAACEESNVGER
jgi:hypothetical protein